MKTKTKGQIEAEINETVTKFKIVTFRIKETIDLISKISCEAEQIFSFFL